MLRNNREFQTRRCFQRLVAVIRPGDVVVQRRIRFIGPYTMDTKRSQSFAVPY